MDYRPVRVKLLCSMPTVICKFLDQIFISLAQFIFRTVGNGQCQLRKMLQEIFQQAIRQTIFIRPGAITENAGQLIAVRLFNSPECADYRLSDIFRCLPDILPMVPFRDNEGMILLKQGGIIPVILDKLIGFLIINIAEALKEEQRNNILFVASRIDICP